MDKAEALTVLRDELAVYRRKSYSELEALLDQSDHHTARGPSGVSYGVEIQVFSDDPKARKGGNIRVAGSVDDGGLRAFVPLTDDFIIRSDGSYVGE